MSLDGTHSVDYYHKKLGSIMWEKCGMAREAAGLREAIRDIRALREDFWKNVKVPGRAEELNVSLEKAGRVADFLELGELMCIDALHREESCGGHFRGAAPTCGRLWRPTRPPTRTPSPRLPRNGRGTESPSSSRAKIHGSGRSPWNSKIPSQIGLRTGRASWGPS